MRVIKTAVIGASGYIGRHLLTHYRKHYPDTVGTGFSRVSADLTSFDLRQPNLNDLRLEDSRHQAVLISSAMPNVGWCEAHPKDSYALNVQGTLELVRQLARTSLTTIFLSSDYVFDGALGGYSDKSIPAPVTGYGRQKAEVEQEIPNITDNYLILRLSKIYGTTFKDGTLIDDLAANLTQGKRIKAASDQFFSPTHVRDVVTMTHFLQQQNVKGLFNVCYAKPFSRYQIATQLAEQLALPVSLIEEVELHSIPSMENRPLNTSLQCSPILNTLQSSLLSIDSAIQTIATNWKQYAEPQKAINT